jgi:hypothetical protein
MPKRDSNDSRGSRSDRSDRPERSERPRSGDRRTTVSVDEQALALRERNASYSSIARHLTLPRATDAHRAFIRAISSRNGDEQLQLVAKERVRLDELEVRIRERDAADPEKLERRLKALGNLRTALP